MKGMEMCEKWLLVHVANLKGHVHFLTTTEGHKTQGLP